MAELTFSTASTEDIMKFCLGMGLFAFIVGQLPLGNLIRYAPSYLVAVTMGPLWGAFTATITIMDVIIQFPRFYFPDMAGFYGEWVLLPALLAGPSQALLTGFFTLRLRPLTSLITANLITNTLPFSILIIHLQPGFFPMYVWLLIGLIYQGTPLLATWITLQCPQLTQHFPGYTPTDTPQHSQMP